MNLRLAYHPTGKCVDDSLSSPTIRLAITIEGGGSMSPKAFERHLAPTIRLAHSPGAQGDNILMGRRGVVQIEKGDAPALLVSFVYLEPFLKMQDKYAYRDWALDSGAFSAFYSGKPIILQAYIDCCKKLMADDPTLTEIFSLDVIGDHKASLKNVEEMWKQGVPAIPAFHIGSPWDALLEMAKTYPKVALGGVARMSAVPKIKWANQCFARIWPKRVHGFGFAQEKAVLALPWHSVDATNWEIGPCKYGRWNAFGKMSVRGSSQNLRAEIDWYMKLEQRARFKWKKQMTELETLDPTVRLALVAPQTPGKRQEALLKEEAPTIRLAMSGMEKQPSRINSLGKEKP